MELAEVQIPREQVALLSTHSRESGFVTVTALKLLPLLLGVVVAVSTVVITLQRRAEAQSLCVRQATQLSDELGRLLRKLMALNSRARILRRSLRVAEKARAIAGLAGPEAIAAADALVWALKLMRTALAAQQKMILARAEVARLRHKRALASGARGLHAKRSRLSLGNARALAVEPRPKGDVAPEYFPVKGFARRQEVTGSVILSIASNFESWGALNHKLTCKVTNERKEKKWKPKIVAASARSKRHWWLSR